MLNKLYQHLNTYKIYLAIGVVALSLVIILALILSNRPPQSYSLDEADLIFPEFEVAGGILILNTDKSQYLLNETIVIGAISLDASGQALCNSNLSLKLEGLQDNGLEIPITQSPNCGTNTNDFDYTASFQLPITGNYTLSLLNLDSQVTNTREIIVTEAIEVSVQRSGAARVNTSELNRYSMILTITSPVDLSATVIESLPSDIKIAWYGNAIVEDNSKNNNSRKTMAWNVELIAGEPLQIAYEYSIPQKKEESYSLGLLELVDSSGNKIFSERSAWELAVITD